MYLPTSQPAQQPPPNPRPQLPKCHPSNHLLAADSLAHRPSPLNCHPLNRAPAELSIPAASPMTAAHSAPVARSANQQLSKSCLTRSPQRPQSSRRRCAVVSLCVLCALRVLRVEWKATACVALPCCAFAQNPKYFPRFSQGTRNSRCAALREFTKSAQRTSKGRGTASRTRRARSPHWQLATDNWQLQGGPMAPTTDTCPLATDY